MPLQKNLNLIKLVLMAIDLVLHTVDKLQKEMVFIYLSKKYLKYSNIDLGKYCKAQDIEVCVLKSTLFLYNGSL